MDTYAMLKKLDKAVDELNERIDALQKIFTDEIERQKAEVKAAQEKATTATTKKGSK